MSAVWSPAQNAAWVATTAVAAIARAPSSAGNARSVRDTGPPSSAADAVTGSSDQPGAGPLQPTESGYRPVGSGSTGALRRRWRDEDPSDERVRAGPARLDRTG